MAYDFSKVNVLVVESTAEMFKLFKNVLAMLEVPDRNIHSAYSKDEGFEKFCSQRHDIVITDWLDNPDTGIELVKKIRTDDKSPNKFVPIIMTAGSSHLTRVLKSRDSGVSEYLVKPFAADALATRLTRVIEKPRPFVISKTYTGHDRRVKTLPFKGEDRRKEKLEIEYQ
ncbi:MAG: response regulator [Micavibrio sp.]|nr:response regulator [Micavibrio sp.]